tara:strand:+ start:582 stop:812 length:231 start_codon:yes stop_codon:yes gene_type:complete
MKLSSSSQLEKITRKTAGLLGLKKSYPSYYFIQYFFVLFRIPLPRFFIYRLFLFLIFTIFLSSLSILNEQVAEILE